MFFNYHIRAYHLACSCSHWGERVAIWHSTRLGEADPALPSEPEPEKFSRAQYHTRLLGSSSLAARSDPPVFPPPVPLVSRGSPLCPPVPLVSLSISRVSTGALGVSWVLQ